MVLKYLLLAFCITTYATPLHNFKCEYNIDTTNFVDGSFFKADYQVVKNHLTTSKIFNPKFKYFMDGSFDIGYSIGARKGAKFLKMGIHPFLHYYYNPMVSFWHSGVSLEVFTPTWEIRNNFYYPFPRNKKAQGLNWKSHKWHELEVTKNFDVFSLTCGIFYNYTLKKPAGRFKFIFPQEKYYVSVGVNVDPFQNFIPFASITFNFCDFKNVKNSKPISYAQRVWCHGKYEFPKTKIEIKEEKDELPNSTEIEVLPEEEPEEIISPPSTNTNDKHWWENIFSSTE